MTRIPTLSTGLRPLPISQKLGATAESTQRTLHKAAARSAQQSQHHDKAPAGSQPYVLDIPQEPDRPRRDRKMLIARAADDRKLLASKTIPDNQLQFKRWNAYSVMENRTFEIEDELTALAATGRGKVEAIAKDLQKSTPSLLLGR